jgi:hypothetical protein
MQNEQAHLPQRQPYARPSLTTFGLVRELTAGGSSGTAENNPKCKSGTGNPFRC